MHVFKTQTFVFFNTVISVNGLSKLGVFACFLLENS